MRTGAINNENQKTESEMTGGSEDDEKEEEEEVPFRKCSVCNELKPFNDLKKCSRCKNQYYLVCSKECQKKDWKNHKQCCTPANRKKLNDKKLANGKLIHQSNEEGNHHLLQGIRKCAVNGGEWPVVPNSTSSPFSCPDGFVPPNANPHRPKEAMVIPIGDQGDPLGFVYTKGLHELHGLPEFLAIDIPADKICRIVRLINELAFCFQTTTGKFFNGYKTEMSGIWVTSLHPQEDQVIAFKKSMGKIHSQAKVIVLKPVFDEWEYEPSLPASLKGKEKYIETVLAKWKKYRENNPPLSYALEQDILSKHDITGESSARCLWLGKDTAMFRGENESYLRRLGYSELCLPDDEGGNMFLEDAVSNLHLAPNLYKRGEKVAQGRYMWKYYRDIVDGDNRNND